MKFFITTLATLVSTIAFADGSDRYSGLRLDTSERGVVETVADPSAQVVTKAVSLQSAQVTFSSSGSKGVGYHYANIYGVGPNNDSR